MKIKFLSSVTENDDYVYGRVLDNYKIGYLLIIRYL